MIYTVISTVEKNRIQENRDCCISRQPLNPFPDSLTEYIENTKNESLKQERRLAYSTLFCSLKAFFGLDAPQLLRTENGKPYLKNCNISISLSHSDGIAAVCISDEGQIGIDIQSEIAPEKQEKLERRFFTDYEVKSERIGVKYYFCTFCDNEAIFDNIDPDICHTHSFSVKWSAAESLMKLNGGGFGDIASLPHLAKKSKTDIREIIISKKYYLAISIKQEE